MDGLEELASFSFETSQEFLDKQPNTARTYSTVRVCESARDSVEESKLDADGVNHFFEYATPATGSSEFRLIRLNRQADSNVLEISKSLFDKLFQAVGCSPCMLYLISQDYDGFHRFPGTHGSTCYYIGTAWYALMWAFRPSDMCTSAMFIQRRGETYEGLVQLLWTYRNHIYTPSFLIFISVLHQIRLSDKETANSEAVQLRKIERKTGYRWNPENTPQPSIFSRNESFQIADVAEWSQKVGEILGHVSNKIRHQSMSISLLSHFKEDFAACLENIRSTQCLDKRMECTKELYEAIPVLERKVCAYKEYLLFLQDRAKNLSSVLFAILTHKDAVASINLTNTSHSLAETAKRDTSSMKTMAVMTMAFLPGTFFAALFAVPFFKWDQSKVVQDNFGVYLAFTLPSTAVIFLLWLSITNPRWFTRRPDWVSKLPPKLRSNESA